MNRIQRLPWDSAYFGLPIGALRGHRLQPSSASAAVREARRKKLRCLYFLAMPEPGTIAAAETQGFVLADIRVTLRADIARLPAAHRASKFHVRTAAADDVAALRRLAAGAHRHSRFLADAEFPRPAARHFYAEWIARAVEGRFDDRAWVALHGKTIAGYLSVRDAGRIGLIGVAPKWRRRGVAGALLHKGFLDFRARGVATVDVVTQAANAESLALYQRWGFRIVDVKLWYHRWL